MTDTQTQKGQPGLVEAALLGLCPECGAKTLFSGPAKFAERCEKCGLDYAAFNVGDGPAALWAALSHDRLPAGPEVNRDAIVQAFQALPPQLRRDLAELCLI